MCASVGPYRVRAPELVPTLAYALVDLVLAASAVERPALDRHARLAFTSYKIKLTK